MQARVFQGEVEGPPGEGRTVDLFLGEFVCHLLKWLSVSPAGLQPRSTGATVSGNGLAVSRGFFCAAPVGRVQGREHC